MLQTSTAPNALKIDAPFHGLDQTENRADRILAFNEQMERTAALPLNETDLERLVAGLPPLSADHPRKYWLTAARIMELALICAGDYADGCEFEAAGDLLVNPRAIDIQVRDIAAPIRKERHARLSDQLSGWIGDADPVRWLAENALPRMLRRPLLPELRDWLETSGIFAPAYLNSVDDRMRRIADAIAFLSAGCIGDASDLFHRTRTMDPEAASLLESHLCRFDRAAFDAMGDAVRWLAEGEPSSFRPSVMSILIQ
jgi:hypothetical protein